MGKAATWEPMGSVTFWQWVLKAERSECFNPPEPVRGRLCSTLLNPEVPGAHGHASTCDIYFQSRTAWIYPNMRHRKCSELVLKMQKQSHSCGGLLHPVPCNPHTWTRWEMALHCTLGSGHLKSPKSRDFTNKKIDKSTYNWPLLCVLAAWALQTLFPIEVAGGSFLAPEAIILVWNFKMVLTFTANTQKGSVSAFHNSRVPGKYVLSQTNRDPSSKWRRYSIV